MNALTLNAAMGPAIGCVHQSTDPLNAMSELLANIELLHHRTRTWQNMHHSRARFR